MTANHRILLYPVLLLAAAAVLWHLPGSGEPLPEPFSAEQPTGPGRALPPIASEGRVLPLPDGPLELHALPSPESSLAPRLVPGSALLDPATWPWPGPGIPHREAARLLARIRWTPPRTPLPGEAELPDPDGIGPCPPRNLPRGHLDSPVVRRYIDPQSLEPTWVHSDGSLTALHVYVEEQPDGSRRPGVTRRTAVRKTD